ncbi:MAG TPA: peptidase C39 family protein [Candidatus Thermoplasmatota archaeon]|nr:peptidase C39 family protein [Candidatus Thermoplasmatota archaeon]
MGDSDGVVLDVPYFQQTRTATCGPACLMMVMRYWDSSFEFSRRAEFNLWMKSFSLLFLGGTYQFGLANAAVDAGYKAEIYQKSAFSKNYPRCPRLFDFLEYLVSFNTRRTHIPIACGTESMSAIRGSLRRGIPPIVFVNLAPLVSEHVFHWVVVTGVGNQTVYLNDPYVPENSGMVTKKAYPIPLPAFQRAIDTDVGRHLRLPPSVVLVYR